MSRIILPYFSHIFFQQKEKEDQGKKKEHELAKGVKDRHASRSLPNPLLTPF